MGGPAEAKAILGEHGIRFENSASEATAAATLAASVNYPLRGAVTFKGPVGVNVASDALANLSSGGKLDMQIKVEKGRSCVPGNLRRYGPEPTKSLGRIVLHASLPPVPPVSSPLYCALVGERT